MDILNLWERRGPASGELTSVLPKRVPQRPDAMWSHRRPQAHSWKPSPKHGSTVQVPGGLKAAPAALQATSFFSKPNTFPKPTASSTAPTGHGLVHAPLLIPRPLLTSQHMDGSLQGGQHDAKPQGGARRASAPLLQCSTASLSNGCCFVPLGCPHSTHWEGTNAAQHWAGAQSFLCFKETESISNSKKHSFCCCKLPASEITQANSIKINKTEIVRFLRAHTIVNVSTRERLPFAEL